MDACGMAVLRLLTVWTALGLFAAAAEQHETANFVVTAADLSTARAVAEAAEDCRIRLAEHWLGRRMPRWSRPCRVSVNVGSMGAGGSTTFQFVNGEVLHWRMNLQGSLERILDSVLPHEINHTVFASYFRRPLPRWADEGAATLFEHSSEQAKQLHLLQSVVDKPGQRFSLAELLRMKEYPTDSRRMLILYAQGYALADFLVQQRGQTAYLKFLSAAETDDWEQAIRGHFDHAGVESLERNWLAWIRAGMPRLNHGEPTVAEQLALRSAGKVRGNSAQVPAASKAVIRSQTPENSQFAAGRESKPEGSVYLPNALPVSGSRRQLPGSSEGVGGAVKGKISQAVKPGYRDFRLQAPAPRPNSAQRSAIERSEEQSPGRLEGFRPTMHRAGRSSISEGESAGGRERVPQWAGFPGQRPLF